MNEFLITNISGIFIGIISAIIASYMYEKFQQRRERKPLDDILNFGRKESLIFVFPPRTDVTEIIKPGQHIDLHILPKTSTEDFLAINNIKSALLQIHWEGKDSVRQPDTLKAADREKNIFCICSSKSNVFTGKVEELVIPLYDKIYRVRQKGNTGEHEIWDGTSETASPTYEQAAGYLKDGISPNRLFAENFVDYAYITKITNPFNQLRNSKIFIIAGIRGIGTWGAAECLKKNWKQIHNKLDPANKKSNFSALIKITYENLDIIETKVETVIPLPD